jgi:hypothetical protein
MLVGLFSWALRPRRHEPADLLLFPGKSEFHSETPDAALDEVVLPGFHLAASAAGRLRVIQHGSTQSYLLYIVVALLALLLWR